MTDFDKKFESFANSERYKTGKYHVTQLSQFESFANSERYKTIAKKINYSIRLRALLIQKDTKQRRIVK